MAAATAAGAGLAALAPIAGRGVSKIASGLEHPVDKVKDAVSDAADKANLARIALGRADALASVGKGLLATGVTVKVCPADVPPPIDILKPMARSSLPITSP